MLFFNSSYSISREDIFNLRFTNCAFHSGFVIPSDMGEVKSTRIISILFRNKAFYLGWHIGPYSAYPPLFEKPLDILHGQF